EEDEEQDEDDDDKEEEHSASAESIPPPPALRSDPDEDPEEDPADYPADHDDKEEPSGDDADDEDEEQDEDDDDKEEEHPASANSIPPPSALCVTARISFRPQPPTLSFTKEDAERFLAMPIPSPSPLTPLSSSLPQISSPPLLASPPILPIPLPAASPPLQLLSSNRRADKIEVTLPPRKRLSIVHCPGYEAGESSVAAAARPIEGRKADYGFVDYVEAEIRRQRAEDIGYGIRDTLIDLRDVAEEEALTTLEGVNTRVTELAVVQEQDTQDIYGVIEGTRDTIMSDSEDSTVTYTTVFSPYEGRSGDVSPGVDGPPAPPSPVYIPYVPEPVYPEYIPPEDDVFLAEEQPLPTAGSPAAEDDADEEDEDQDEEDDDEEEEHPASTDSIPPPPALRVTARIS
nr:hypothetical protein [Tanacetum cinerariifolium]